MLPLTIADFEEHARRTLTPAHFGFFVTGAEDEVTLQRNKDAFKQLLLRPRVLVDVEKVSTATTILGQPIRSPICVAPTSLHGMAHRDGEKATAKACADFQTCYCMSTYSNYSMKEVTQLTRQSTKSPRPDPLQWFQLYVERDRAMTEKLVRQCEQLGFKALVLTVDRPKLGRRLADLRNGFLKPAHLTFGNFEDGGGSFGNDIDPTLDWDSIAWLKRVTKLPIVLKGVMHAADAVRAVERGVDAVWVSNHGARQLDTVPAPIEVLPDVVAACRGKSVEVYVDGGIRHGTDVFKALALGARAVFLGRPIIWGLAYKGQDGVKQVLSQLTFDLQLSMALAGCTSVDKITKDYVAAAEDYSFSKTLSRL